MTHVHSSITGRGQKTEARWKIDLYVLNCKRRINKTEEQNSSPKKNWRLTSFTVGLLGCHIVFDWLQSTNTPHLSVSVFSVTSFSSAPVSQRRLLSFFNCVLKGAWCQTCSTCWYPVTVWIVMTAAVSVSGSYGAASSSYALDGVTVGVASMVSGSSPAGARNHPLHTNRDSQPDSYFL